MESSNTAQFDCDARWQGAIVNQEIAQVRVNLVRTPIQETSGLGNRNPAVGVDNLWPHDPTAIASRSVIGKFWKLLFRHFKCRDLPLTFAVNQIKRQVATSNLDLASWREVRFSSRAW